jgi:hypothetical protein
VIEEMNEAGEDEEGDAVDGERPNKGPTVVAGSPKKPKVKEDPVGSSPPPDKEQEVPDEEDPADDEIEADVEDDESKPSGFSDELVGKTIQSVTREPKSKILPGAEEIVLTFNEITDPLRILVSKTGQVRFFFRNALHNLI